MNVSRFRNPRCMIYNLVMCTSLSVFFFRFCSNAFFSSYDVHVFTSVFLLFIQFGIYLGMPISSFITILICTVFYYDFLVGSRIKNRNHKRESSQQIKVTTTLDFKQTLQKCSLILFLRHVDFHSTAGIPE